MLLELGARRLREPPPPGPPAEGQLVVVEPAALATPQMMAFECRLPFYRWVCGGWVALSVFTGSFLMNS